MSFYVMCGNVRLTIHTFTVCPIHQLWWISNRVCDHVFDESSLYWGQDGEAMCAKNSNRSVSNNILHWSERY